MDDDARLHLLLADGDGRPVIEDGLPADASASAPPPEVLRRRADNARNAARDTQPNDLRQQRWGVVVPEGKEGDRLLAEVAPLIRLREEEQGAPARVYRGPPDMDADAAVAWRDSIYLAEDVPEPERPAYLLLLGSPHQISFELQHVLAHGAYVGRLSFDDEEGYSAYAGKAVRWAARRAEEDAPDLAFYVARDGTAATVDGERLLLRPLIDHLGPWRVPAKRVDEIAYRGPRPDDLLAAAQGARPCVLLSVTHGEGAPLSGWKGPDEQRALQGALSLGKGGRLDADAVRSGRFLPGGAWICVACFGAGTPKKSVFLPWLEQLAALGAYRKDQLGQVTRSLPSDRAFVAAMPQAALANPEGPLAIFGHVDLSWSYGFASTDFAQSRSSRILKALRPLARGSRAGLALDALMEAYREANADLTVSYEIQQGLAPGATEDAARRRKRGHLWMLRNELRGYVLLGDPAARLPLRDLDEAAGPVPPAPPRPAPQDVAAGGGGSPRYSPPSPASPEVAAKEAAVLALLRGDETPRAIAARANTSMDTLWAWFDAYRSGARSRL